MKEGRLLRDILLSVSKEGHRLFRCNSGMGWTGKVERNTINPGDIVIKNARPFHGFPKGTPDLIGWAKVTVTQEMVGQEIAVFTAIEAKTKNVRTTKEQENFINQVNISGGISGIARDSEDANKIIGEYDVR